VLDNHGSRHTPASIAHPALEKGKFLGSKVDSPIGTRYTAFHPVQFKIFDGENRVRWKTTSPQKRAASRGSENEKGFTR
jgi:hypothetical protein